MYGDTTQTKSLFKTTPQATPLTFANGQASFIGNENVEIPIEQEQSNTSSFIGKQDVKIPVDDKYVVVCGRWYTYFDPAGGKPRTYQKRCGKNTCKICVTEKARDLVERLPIDPVYVTTILDDDWQAVHKHLKREGILYQRIKQENDESVIILECDDPYFDDLERKSEITIEQAKMWLRNKPDGSRITGKLCASKSSTSDDNEEKGETVKVSFDMVCTNASYEQQRAALKIAIYNTRDLLPDEKTLQDALNKRISEYKKALLEMKCKICHTISVTRNVQITRIDWSDGNCDPRYLDTFQCVGGEKDGPVPF